MQKKIYHRIEWIHTLLYNQSKNRIICSLCCFIFLFDLFDWMKFGKEFKVHLEDTLPEWRDKYLRYKPLKKLLKSLPAHPSAAAAGDDSFQPPPHSELHDWFIRLLTEDLEKFNDFYVEQEEEFIIRFQVSFFSFLFWLSL